MPPKNAPAKKAPKKDMITAAGEGLRSVAKKVKPMIEKGAAAVQKAVPSASNKFKEKAAADAKKGKKK